MHHLFPEVHLRVPRQAQRPRQCGLLVSQPGQRRLLPSGILESQVRKARFNPDLIAFTDSGKTAVLEYKGEDRVTNEDSRYKESLGNDWAALDPERRYFKMVTKGNMQSTLKEIEEL